MGMILSLSLSLPPSLPHLCVTVTWLRLHVTKLTQPVDDLSKGPQGLIGRSISVEVNVSGVFA